MEEQTNRGTQVKEGPKIGLAPTDARPQVRHLNSSLEGG